MLSRRALTAARSASTAAARHRRYTVPSWASLDPDAMSSDAPGQLRNLVNGEWTGAAKYTDIIDPMDGSLMLRMPDTSSEELQPFVDSLAAVPKTGLHNAFKHPERFIMLGEVSHKAGAALSDPDVAHFFTRCIQRVCPKSYDQAMGEVTVTAQFLKNFGGDGVRFMAQDFGVTGDRAGQHSRGYRWPYGPVGLVSPFNFPLEIPALQVMGAVYMGNKPCMKAASTVSLVMEQFLLMLHHCGLPEDNVDLLHCGGRVMGELLDRAPIRVTQFTGSTDVGERLAVQTAGKIKLEDAGFDWKVLGPDVPAEQAAQDYVAWQCDQDAYACTGQKCSAQSILFMHENWRTQADLLGDMERLAGTRNLDELTVGPVLTETSERMLGHAERLLAIPGARLLFGGKKLEGHAIPDCYGAIEPTAVFVPLEELVKEEHFGACVTEIFGPFQVVTEYADGTLDDVLGACERMSHHLTAAVVSNDAGFLERVLAHTVNGTTYAGIRARTTGAPQNHWFGPAGDPRGAGIGTREAIRMVWSCHREVIYDQSPIEAGWERPKQT